MAVVVANGRTDWAAIAIALYCTAAVFLCISNVMHGLGKVGRFFFILSLSLSPPPPLPPPPLCSLFLPPDAVWKNHRFLTRIMLRLTVGSPDFVRDEAQPVCFNSMLFRVPLTAVNITMNSFQGVLLLLLLTSP
jgi:hypothetical protein